MVIGFRRVAGRDKTVQNRVLIFFKREKGIANDLKGLFRTAKISHLQLFGLQVVNGSVRVECISFPKESDIASQQDIVRIRVVFCIVAINRDIAVSDDDIPFCNGDSTLESGFSGRDLNRDRSGVCAPWKGSNGLKSGLLRSRGCVAVAGVAAARWGQMRVGQADSSAAKSERKDLESGAS